MAQNIKRGIFKLLPFTMVAILVSGLFLFTTTTPPSVFAAIDDYTVSGGDPGSLPTVGAASVALGTVTMVDVGADDFSNLSPGEVFNITINPANYGAVEFDQTVVFGGLTVAGTCNHNAATALTYPSATVAQVTVTGAGGAGTCAAGTTITIAGLKIKTIYAQVAPGANYLVNVDNAMTSIGAPVNSSTTVNYSVAAADANASVVLASPTVGATGDTTVGLTVPFALDAADTIDIIFPAHINVSGVGLAATGTFESGANITCAPGGGQLVTCTTDGATLTTGTIIMTGITSSYAGIADIVSVEVEDEGAELIIATDTVVSLTDSTADDAVASLALAGNSVVGTAGNTTLTISIPVDMGGGDTIVFDVPANLDITSVAWVSESFGGAGNFACVATDANTVTCTTDNTITAADGGNIVMSGITSKYAATGQTISAVVINDTGNGNTATDGSGTVTDTTAADAGATVTLAGNSVVGIAGDTTVNLTLPIALANTDTVDITFPAQLNVSAAAFGSETFAGGGTFGGCVAAGQVVTCTANGAITAGNGNIVISGITSSYAGNTDATLVEVEAAGVAANDIATDNSIATTNSTAADAGATVTLTGNSVVGVAGNTSVNLTLPIDLANTDTVDITFPAHLSVAGVTFVSEDFAGGGTFSGCSAVGQVVTCTANGVITAGNGNTVMSGIYSLYAATTDITSVEVEAAGNAANDIATDGAVALTDSTAADAGATVTLAGNSVVGVAGNTTVNLTLPIALANTDTVDITFPAHLSVVSAAFVSETFGGGGTFGTCAAAGQVVTCTSNGVITAGNGNIVISGIFSLYAATTDITDVQVEAAGVAANDIATDGAVALTDSTAADAGATVTLAGNSVVGVAGNTTVNLTLPIALANTDTVDITFPAQFNVASAAFVSETFAGGGTFGTCAAAGQVVTCASNGVISAGNGNIVISGISSLYVAIADVSSVEVEAAGVAANDIATDSSVATTDSTAADAGATVTLAGNSVVGAAGNTTLTVSVPVNMVALDYIQFTAPNNLNVSGVGYGSTTFLGGGAFTCATAGPQIVKCTATGAITAGTGNIVMTGITGLYAAAGQTIISVIVYDTSATANTATDASGTVTNTTAADAAATVTLGANATVGTAGTTTLALTLPFALDADDTIELTFPAFMNVSGVGAAVTGTLEASDSITCAAVGQLVTCTTSAATNAAGTIIFTGITSSYEATTDVSSVEVEDEGVAANDIATDTSVATTNSTAATLLVTNVQPATLVGGATGIATVTFTTINPLPADGKIKVGFGAGFDLTGVGAADGTCSSMDGTFVTSVVGQTVIITRQNDGAQEAAGVQTCAITDVKNPGVAGSTGTYTILTTTTADGVLDADSAVAADTITAAALSATNVAPATLVVNQTGVAAVTFTTGLAIPNNGKIKVTFGANFDLSGVGAADGACSSMDGTFVTSVAGQVVTLTRQADGASEPAGAQTCAITDVKNPGFAGTTGTYTIITTTTADATIESDAAVTADTITAAALAATNVDPATFTPSASGTATVTFTTINTLPNNGKIKVTFGAGYNVTAASGGTCSTMDGTFVTSVAGQIVTLTRQADGAAEAAGAQTCTIANITNPTAGSTGVYGIATTNTTNGVVDEDAAVSADTIVSANVACNDGVDNDADGLIDMADPGCTVGTDTSEVDESSGGGGGGGGGGQTSTTSNTTTSTIASNISTITGDQTYSRAVQMETSAITVDTVNETKTAQLTEDGTLTLRPNSQSTISLSVPANTEVTGTTNWDGRIDPPLVQSINLVNTAGEDIVGTTDTLERSEVAVVIKAGSDKSTLTFSNDITINIPVNLPNGTTIKLYSSKEGNTWDYLGTGVVVNGVVVVTTNHLTYFAVAPGAGPIAAAEEAANAVFGDIAGHWAEAFITRIFDLGIVSGKTPTTFAPDDSITRAELTKMAVKAFNLQRDPVTTTSFIDVAVDAWYAAYIEAAAKAGWVQGYDALEGTAKAFSPNANINRAEALKILLEAAGFTNIDSNFETNYSSHPDYTFAAFPDVMMGDWFAKYVGYAKDHDIVGGYSDGSFGPGNNVTRAETAKIITKILDME